MSFTATTTRPATPRARTLLDVFNATAVRCPDHTAIDADDASLTYGQLAVTAGALASRLRDSGVRTW